MQVIEIGGGSATVVRLDVSWSSLDFVVGSGSFRVAGQDYVLEEEQVFTVEPDSKSSTAIHGYLVRSKQDDKAILLIDAFVDEPAYVFSADSPYELLWHLVSMNVPPGATSGDDVSGIVRVTTEEEE